MIHAPVTDKPRKIPVSVLVVMYAADGRFLLIERADRAGFWQSVTGSLDYVNEAPLLAAVRELQEETGFAAQPDSQAQALSTLSRRQLLEPYQVRSWPHQLQFEIFEHWRKRYGPGVTHNTEHWFAVCLPVDAKPALAANEHVAYEWLGPEEAASRCFSPNNADAILKLTKILDLAK